MGGAGLEAARRCDGRHRSGVLFLLPALESREQMPGNAKVYLHVKSGMTTREIGAQLEQHGVIESRTKFWLVAKLEWL